MGVNQPTVKLPTVKLPTVRMPTMGGSVRSTTPLGDRSTPVNSEQTRRDDLSSLEYSPYESLDRSQTWASPGDTVPVVFCKRTSNAGGTWVSMPLLDAGSLNFDRTFVYLFSQGFCSFTPSSQNLFSGKNRMSALVSTGFTYYLAYSNDSTICPIGSLDITCDHTNFRTAIESLGTDTNSRVTYNTVGEYATSVTIRAKPIHFPNNSGTLATYGVTVKRMNLDGLAGTVTTVGSFTTSSSGAVSTITDTVTAGTYIYSIENTGASGAGVTPETILLEVQQNNTFPTSHDRTSSYYDLSLIAVEGNLYDPSRSYSSPTDLKQLHIFAEEGIRVGKWRNAPGGTFSYSYDSSDKFGDLALWYTDTSPHFTNTENFQALSVLDVANAADFHNQYDIRFNGVITTTTNFLSWAQQTAPYFLLNFHVQWGYYNLKPLLPLNGDGTIATGALTDKVREAFNDTETGEDEIDNTLIAGTYRKTYISSEQRRQFQVLVSWRSQDEYGVETSQTTKVRYSDYADDAPEEAYDMTAFCSNVDHAKIFAKYLLATRRYSTHVIKFETARNVQGSDLEIYDLITMTLTRLNSAGDNVTESEYYLVTGVTSNQDGVTEIEAEHFPVDGTNASIISNSIISGSFTIET